MTPPPPMQLTPPPIEHAPATPAIGTAAHMYGGAGPMAGFELSHEGLRLRRLHGPLGRCIAPWVRAWCKLFMALLIH